VSIVDGRGRPSSIAIFVLDLKILKWDTKPSEGAPAIVLAR